MTFSVVGIIMIPVIIMKFTIYKINELPEYQKKLYSLCKDITFLEFNPSVKKYLFTDKCESNFYYCVALMCENFLELSLVFTLTEIADLLEKGIALALKDNPEVSQIKIINANGKDELHFSTAPEIQVETIRTIASAQIRKKHGRANAVIDEDFVEDYWKWQLGDYSVNEILNNEDKNYSFSTKQQFYSMAQRYEKTNSYFNQQLIYAKSLIKKKKRGKVDLSSMLNYIKENENNGLNEGTISSLMEILRVNHIDFWRCIKKLYSSRYFRDLNNSIFKTSVTSAMKILDEIDSDFFTTTTSTCIDYTKPLAEVIIEINKINAIFEKESNQI